MIEDRLSRDRSPEALALLIVVGLLVAVLVPLGGLVAGPGLIVLGVGSIRGATAPVMRTLGWTALVVGVLAIVVPLVALVGLMAVGTGVESVGEGVLVEGP